MKIKNLIVAIMIGILVFSTIPANYAMASEAESDDRVSTIHEEEFVATCVENKLFFRVSSTISKAENIKVIEGIKKAVN